MGTCTVLAVSSIYALFQMVEVHAVNLQGIAIDRSMHMVPAPATLS